MRHESTGKSDPERARASEPADPEQKRGFFATAGARLKRVIGRTEPIPSASSEPAVALSASEDPEAEVSTSVQARARELLLEDRARRRAGGEEENLDAHPEQELEGAGEKRARRSTPPPLPSQRMAAGVAEEEQPNTGVTAIPPKRAARIAPKRPVRDSKSEALRARLGAAKAALAEAQAKRTESELAALPDAAEHNEAQPLAASSAADNSAQPDTTEREVTLEEADLDDADDDPEIELLYDTEYEADDSLAEMADAEPAPALATAANSGDAGGGQTEKAADPIRTLTIARLLARQGYFERSLSIYDELLATDASDPELRAEAEKIRAKKRAKKSAD